MKILINGSIIDSAPTGIGVLSIQLTKALVAAAFECKITLPTSAPEHFAECQSLVKLMPISLWTQSSQFPRIAPFSRIAWNGFVLPKIAKDHDVVLCPTPHGSLGLHNQVVVIHDVLPLRYPYLSAFRHNYFKIVVPRLARVARRIIAVSETTKRDIIHFYQIDPDKIHVVANGVDHEFFNPGTTTVSEGDRQGERFILSVGATWEHKNLCASVTAFKSLVQAGYPGRYMIAGGLPKYISRLRALADSLNISDRVIILGYVKRDKLVDLYRTADFLVYPSLFEGFGLPPLEAMASGCPVSTSDTASLPEVCGSAANYFDPLSIKSITASMSDLAFSRTRRDELRQRGLQRAREFSWQVSARNVYDILRSA